MYTFSGPLLLKVLRSFASLHLDVDALLAGAELSAEHLECPESRVLSSKVDLLWRLAESRREDIGLEAARILEAKHLGVLGYVVMSSANVGEALERLVRFKALSGDVSTVRISVSEGRARYIHTTAQPPLSLNRQHAEWSMGWIVLLLRKASAVHGWSPEEVTFRHSEPKDLGLHRSVFGITPKFCCSDDSVVVELSFLRAPLNGADSVLSEILEKHATQLLQSLPHKNDFVRSLQSLLQRQLAGGNPSVETIASGMGLSPRSLQRRLEEHGQNFQTVLDEVREQLADVYLEDASTSIAEVAFLLGYSGTSAFSRAFKRWRLVSPTEWRNRT